jgi:L,D-peptidoglycan transpeptidase YkuD (ErfK/YbiS/YcfS/YnhG family)
LKLALLVVLAACSHADESAVSARPAPHSHASPMIGPSTTQLVTAVVPDWTSTKAELRLWQRDASGWHVVGEPWPGVVGRTGSAWGVGVHGDGPPAGRQGPRKHEGDGKSPAGVFAIRGAYGYADAPPTGTRLHYTPVGESWKCVDDPQSSHYAEIVDDARVDIDWKSAEDMRRKDDAYTWVVDLAHNPTHHAGDGSCIFLHVWRGEDSSTVGCTAMAQPPLEKLVAALDPARQPMFVLLPRAEYEALAPVWGLPAR